MSQNQYIILDAARMEGLLIKAKELNERHICLFEGESEEFRGAEAPWMFQLERDSKFADWLLTESLARKWDMVIILAKDGGALYEHLRKILIISTSNKKELYFRYYNASVLQAFLPTCETEQLTEFFGPIESFVMQHEKGGIIEFQLQVGKLLKKHLEWELSANFQSNKPPVEDSRFDPDQLSHSKESAKKQAQESPKETFQEISQSSLELNEREAKEAPQRSSQERLDEASDPTDQQASQISKEDQDEKWDFGL